MTALDRMFEVDDDPPTLTARRAKRAEAGSCLSCPHDHQPTWVWVIMTGCVEVRFCERHLKMLKKMTGR